MRIAAEIVPPGERHGKQWSHAERALLISILEEERHNPRRYEVAARHLRRTPRAVALKALQYGFPARQTGYLTARDAAHILGISEQAVGEWIEKGHIANVRTNRRKRDRGRRTAIIRHWKPTGRYQIEPDDLWAWLEDPASWHRWRPEDITNADWRAYFHGLRRDWQTVDEAAARLAVSKATIYRMCRAGRLAHAKPTPFFTWIRADAQIK